MNSSLRKIINNFRAFLPTTLSQNEKKKPCKTKLKTKKQPVIWLDMINKTKHKKKNTFEFIHRS